MKNVFVFATAVLCMFFGQSVANAQATIINVNRVGDAINQGGLVINTTDSTYLRRMYFQPNFNSYFVRYDSTTDLVANSAALGTLTLTDSAGTYFAEQAGSIYGHYTPSGDLTAATVGRWDATTGSLVATASVPGFGADFFSDTFDWNGYTAMNVLQDSTGMYLFSGSSSSSDYMLAKLNPDLTVTNPVTVALTLPGWGFMMNGSLYYGAAFYSQGLAGSISATDGSITPLSVYFLGFAPSAYISHAEYVESEDALYLWDADSRGIYKATGISSLLGTSAVPEPDTWAMMLLGFGGIGFAMRRKAAVHALRA